VRRCTYAARIIVPGWCLEPDHMLSVCAHTKALNIQYGCKPMDEDFDRAVRGLGDGDIDPSAWLGGRIRLDQVDEKLNGVANPLNPFASPPITILVTQRGSTTMRMGFNGLATPFSFSSTLIQADPSAKPGRMDRCRHRRDADRTIEILVHGLAAILNIQRLRVRTHTEHVIGLEAPARDDDPGGIVVQRRTISSTTPGTPTHSKITFGTFPTAPLGAA